MSQPLTVHRVLRLTKTLRQWGVISKQEAKALRQWLKQANPPHLAPNSPEALTLNKVVFLDLPVGSHHLH
jgi:hypothetical protein